MSAKAAALTFIGLMAGIVVTRTWVEVLVLMSAGAVVGIAAPPQSFKALWLRLRPFFFFATITVVFGGLANEDPLVTLGPLSWAAEALERAAIAGLRLIAVGVAAGWLTLQVGTATMLAGLWHVGKKVKSLGIDITPLLFGVAIAIRFLPMLQQEAALLQVAWETRGANLFSRGPLGRMRYATGLVVPLLASALRRAEAFAVAVDLRVAAAEASEASETPGEPGGLPDAFASGTQRLLKTKGENLTRFRTSTAISSAWVPIALKVVAQLG